MNKNALNVISIENALAWVLPLPVWSSLVLAAQSVRQTYQLCNQSSVPIRIKRCYLTDGDDQRLTIVGGSCQTGMVLAPQATCTIEVQLSPTALGVVQQILNVEHSGAVSPLWTEISCSVDARGRRVSRKSSYLVEETEMMARQRREMEQDGHRHYARVQARTHADPSQNQNANMAASEGAVQNNILQNPWLNSQRFDGVDPNLSPEPPLNSEAGREFDNERREQEMEKQLRLGNMPRVSPAPKPQGM